MEFSTLLGFMFFAAGSATLIWAWVSFHRATVTMAWPSAPGVVTSSEVDDAGGPAIPVVRGRYEPHVEYRYEVGGTEHTGRSLSRTPYRSASRKSVERVIAQYTVGKPVDVYHHPRNHAVSVLEPGTSPQNYRLFLVGSLFLAAGAGALSGFRF